MLPDFKTYSTAIVIKTEWHWCENRYIVQWNRRKRLEIRTHTYMAGCFSSKSVKVIQEKDSLWYWNNRLSLWNKMNLVPYHTSYRKLIRAKIIKLLQGLIGENLCCPGLHKDFLSGS